MTLTEFLLARIAEDEAVAIATRDGHDPLTWEYAGTGAWGMAGPVDGPSGYEAIVVDPARVLAECKAKRRIVAQHKPWSDDDSTLHLCHDSLADDTDCVELRALAAVYADHPDYREEWRP